jgi:hypothetical protein
MIIAILLAHRHSAKKEREVTILCRFSALKRNHGGLRTAHAGNSRSVEEPSRGYNVFDARPPQWVLADTPDRPSKEIYTLFTIRLQGSTFGLTCELFFGVCGWLWEYVPDFTAKALPLTTLLAQRKAWR